MPTREERVETADGAFAAHVALPDAGGGPGILLLQEIFGVNDYVKDAARRLADLGYVVLAPDLYWRTQPGLALGHSEPELRQALAAVQRLDTELAVKDAVASLAVLRGMPEPAAGALRRC